MDRFLRTTVFYFVDIFYFPATITIANEKIVKGVDMLTNLGFAVAMGALALSLSSSTSYADQDLNQKWGPGWSCNSISLGHPAGVTQDDWQVYMDKCQACENQGLDFIDTSVIQGGGMTGNAINGTVYITADGHCGPPSEFPRKHS